ncbi:hypothetical protein [Pseudoxanthomonas wuyuanensis]|uniref:hypothetical protein n=1 Tax=Pseudoxanthomonas wuyuanensis TaxID=1073196 RepID=UPI000BE22952|nr:hypothetical protein [Pseudoxanthomonas wuyuanensis]KAF1722920.1 hypothetical protein CSC75_00040 [Pseudoxanthomonas wuyuanensis]
MTRLAASPDTGVQIGPEALCATRYLHPDPEAASCLRSRTRSSMCSSSILVRSAQAGPGLLSLNAMAGLVGTAAARQRFR